jgi:hypothetical protein
MHLQGQWKKRNTRAVFVERGLGHCWFRPTSLSSTSASRLSQDPTYVSEMSSMKAQLHELQEENRIINERMAAQDQLIANIQKIIQTLVASNAPMLGNTSASQDNESPNVVRMRSSVAS